MPSSKYQYYACKILKKAFWKCLWFEIVELNLPTTQASTKCTFYQNFTNRILLVWRKPNIIRSNLLNCRQFTQMTQLRSRNQLVTSETYMGEMYKRVFSSYREFIESRGFCNNVMWRGSLAANQNEVEARRWEQIGRF